MKAELCLPRDMRGLEGWSPGARVGGAAWTRTSLLWVTVEA